MILLVASDLDHNAVLSAAHGRVRLGSLADPIEHYCFRLDLVLVGKLHRVLRTDAGYVSAQQP